MRKKWTNDKLARIVEEYRAGKTYREIAGILDATPGDIAQQINRLRSAGVDLPSRVSRGIDVDALNNL